MTCVLFRGFHLACLGLGVLGLSACSKGLPSDTLYRAIDGESAIKIVSSKELELTKGPDRFLCAYSREGERLRVVFDFLGSKQVAYYTVTPDGLQKEDGTVLYSPLRYDQATADRRRSAATLSLFQAITANDPNAVRASLKDGADVNAWYDKEREAPRFDRPGSPTPLHIAAYEGAPEILSLLLDAGADINAQDIVNSKSPDGSYPRVGDTPLLVALSRENEDAVRMLVNRGANRDIKNRKRKSACDIVKDDPKRRAWLVRSEETPEQVNKVRARIVESLHSPGPFFVQVNELGASDVLRMTFEAFDENSGHFSGKLKYMPAGVSFAFDAILEGTLLRLCASEAHKEFALRLSGDKLTGPSSGGDDIRFGDATIDLNEARRSELERKYKE